MRSALPSPCLLLLLVAGAATADPLPRSPFAAWAADVAAPSRAAALPWLGRPGFDPSGAGRADLARVLHAALDRSGPLVGADAAHAIGLSGRGTLVAVIDSGVDFSHPAFLDEAGRPRILWYLDLTLPSRGDAPLDDRGGALFDRDDLARALRDPAAPRPSPDLSGHGTRVAAVAAGDELPAPGLAPGADLLVVRADRLPGGRYDEADVADALAFVFEAADTLGRPCVANLSLGGQAGAHDGSSWLERAIDAALASGPGGRAVVVAAGNDGNAGVHARLVARPDSPARVALLIPANGPLPGAPAALVLLDFWSTAATAFSLGVELPDGTPYERAPGDPGLDVPLHGGAALRLEPPAADDAGRAEALLALVGGDDGAIPPGRYAVTVHGHATVDVWLTVEAETSLFPVRLDGPIVSDTTLSIPATAHRAIAVGSVASRSTWTNHLGAFVETASPASGGASSFTARGPTADGRFKPDLAAPGEWILAAHSAAADWPVLSGGLLATGPDPRVSAARGTSLAAPHVTGAVALLLEREPGLPAADILARLRSAAAGEGRWNDATGFGRLDLSSLLTLRRPPTPPTTTLSVARSSFPADGARTTEIAVLRRTQDSSSAATAPRLHSSAALSVRPSVSGPLWIAALDASRLGPGECAELTVLGDDGTPGDRVPLCVAPEPGVGCMIGGAPARPRSSAWLFGLCLVAVRFAGPALRPRRWAVFAAVSVGAHLVGLAVLARWLPVSQPPLRSSLVAVGIVADVRPPEARTPPVPLRRASPPTPRPITLAQVSLHQMRSPAPLRPRLGTTHSPVSAPAAAEPLSGSPASPPAAAGQAALLPILSPAASPETSPGLDVRPDPGSNPASSPAAAEADPCIQAAGALRAAIDARKRYPTLARRRGLCGTAIVTFTINADGTLGALAVARSSGSRLLDEAALAAVRDAAPFAAAGCSFSLPIQFRLTGSDS